MIENVRSFLSWSETQLTQAGVLSPRLDSEILLAHTLKLSRTELFKSPKRILATIKKVNNSPNDSSERSKTLKLRNGIFMVFFHEK